LAGASAASRGFAYSTIQLSKIMVGLKNIQADRSASPEPYVLISGFIKATNQSIILVEVNGIEPMASCVQGRRSPS
jgi:hypothetical protein